MMKHVRLRVPITAFVAAIAPACTTAGRVQYLDGHCTIDGVVATLAQVEARQSDVTQHVLSRQPVLTAIAVAAVAVASIGYLQRLWTLARARRAEDQTLAERIRSRMERYRAHPVRYFLLIASVLALLISAGVAYVALDADKRASERALANLQFCHLALRSTEEQRVLAEQREHLASIQSTARDIKALVNKLPPAEQDKAHEIVNQLSTSLGQQRSMVAQYAEHADVTEKEVADHQAEVEKGLTKLDGDVGDLKSMPAVITDLAGKLGDVGTHQQALGGEVEANTAEVEALAKQVDALTKQVAELAARPPPACAVAAAPEHPAAAAPAAAGSAAGSATAGAPAAGSGSAVPPQHATL